VITVKELDAIRPAPRPSQSVYVNKIKCHWCPFAKGQGKCDEACHTNSFCKPVLLRATDLSKARVPVALLIYVLRQEREKAEKIAARTAEAPRITKKEMGTADTFAALANELGV